MASSFLRQDSSMGCCKYCYRTWNCAEVARLPGYKERYLRSAALFIYTALCVASDCFGILKIGQTELVPELLKIPRPSVSWTAMVTSSTGVQTAPAMADIQ